MRILRSAPVTYAKRVRTILRDRLVSPAPEEFHLLVYSITNRCNCRCAMCGIWKIHEKDPESFGRELTLEEIRTAFSESRLLRQIRTVLLTGGEPFLRDDFAELLLFLYEINPGLVALVPTNGQRPDLVHSSLNRVTGELRSRGIEHPNLGLGISLDGMGERHDRIRGRKGAFRQALETAGVARKIPGVQTTFAFTFTPQNYLDFPEVCRLSRDMSLPLCFQFVQTSSHYYGSDSPGPGWTPGQLREVREILSRTGHLDPVTEGASSITDRILNHHSYLLEYVLTYGEHPRRPFPCYSGTHSCFLDPYGEVYPCIMLGRRMGNIRQESFDGIWTGESAAEIRTGIHKRECNCHSFCDIPASLSRNLSVAFWNLRRIASGGSRAPSP